MFGENYFSSRDMAILQQFLGFWETGRNCLFYVEYVLFKIYYKKGDGARLEPLFLQMMAPTGLTPVGAFIVI
ncbi:conserved hypothetical protein [Thermincola potens JR]|uniref:Uncharacterized protein n=1 Tax=Thermincola potens (strain JR) TaxID=635013 RepID=D5XBQ7_THEPJ|nr:conserved hypothetical protein [Thermincola potens JR]